MMPYKSSIEKHFLRFVHTTEAKNISKNHGNKIHIIVFTLLYIGHPPDATKLCKLKF
jgi:hypothetical protein